MFTFPFCHYTDGVDNSVQSVVSSANFDLDATQLASYGGSGQTWSNIVPVPNDGNGKTDYDFFLGADNSATTDDPTFTGSAGDSAAYFDLDGGDFFTVKDDANTMFRTMHMTTGGDDWWIALVYQAVISAGQQSYWGNTSAASSHGLSLVSNSNENLRFRQRAATSFNAQIEAAGTITEVDSIVIITGNSTSTGNEKQWYRTSTGSTWDNAYVPITTTTDPLRNFTFGKSGNATPQIVAADTRVYAVSGGNSIITDSEVSDLIALYEGADRHNRSYT